MPGTHFTSGWRECSCRVKLLAQSHNDTAIATDRTQTWGYCVLISRHYQLRQRLLHSEFVTLDCWDIYICQKRPQ